MRERKDFINVSLAAAGRALAGSGGSLRVATAHLHYVIAASLPTEVQRRGEWSLLSKECDAAGRPLFEEFVVPAVVEYAAENGQES